MWPVKAKSGNKGENMKACGHHEEVDGYWCFVETARGKLIFERLRKEPEPFRKTGAPGSFHRKCLYKRTI